jgi:aldehyde dehydrogenase (NAD+)
MTAAAGHEERMLVDGTLVESETGRTFDNMNPATEEVLGQVADGTSADMHRALDGARRAFDETDWSTDGALRTRCLSQLQDALEKEREELREELILEVGCPRMTTHANQLDIPLDSALRYPIKLIDEFPWRTDLSPSSIVAARRTRVRSGRSRSAWSGPSCPGTSPSR